MRAGVKNAIRIIKNHTTEAKKYALLKESDTLFDAARQRVKQGYLSDLDYTSKVLKESFERGSGTLRKITALLQRRMI